MPTLTHFNFCPHSRGIRLVLAEIGHEPALVQMLPWEWSDALLALNPSGELPILQLEEGPQLCGSYAIAEYLAATTTEDDNDGQPVPLFPGTFTGQAEVRRLVDWFHVKLHREVTVPLLDALVVPFFSGANQAPDTDVLRAARANLAYHMSYVAWLADQRNWLAGNDLSYADLAAGAHVSCLDYLGEVDWARWPAVKTWYQRLKSRRAFQVLLTDRIPGRQPAAHYGELDF